MQGHPRGLIPWSGRLVLQKEKWHATTAMLSPLMTLSFLVTTEITSHREFLWRNDASKLRSILRNDLGWVRCSKRQSRGYIIFSTFERGSWLVKVALTLRLQPAGWGAPKCVILWAGHGGKTYSHHCWMCRYRQLTARRPAQGLLPPLIIIIILCVQVKLSCFVMEEYSNFYFLVWSEYQKHRWKITLKTKALSSQICYKRFSSVSLSFTYWLNSRFTYIFIFLILGYLECTVKWKKHTNNLYIASFIMYIHNAYFTLKNIWFYLHSRDSFKDIFTHKMDWFLIFLILWKKSEPDIFKY